MQRNRISCILLHLKTLRKDTMQHIVSTYDHEQLYIPLWKHNVACLSTRFLLFHPVHSLSFGLKMGIHVLRKQLLRNCCSQWRS